MQQTHPARSLPRSSSVKKIYPRDSIRLFKNTFWERFTHVNPLVPLLLWGPVITLLIYRSITLHAVSSLGLLLYGFLGLFFWTLTEYALHRFIFHFPATSPLGKRLVYIAHGLHHEDPVDPTRLVMPPLPAMIYASILFWIFRIILGPVSVETFMAFFLIGYLAYDYTHYYVHFATPKNTVGKFLKRYHMQHHFADYEAKWGVSNPFWDYVFGTVESKSESRSGSRVSSA